MVSPGAIRGGEAQVEVSTDLSPLDRGIGIIQQRMQGLERSIASVGDRGFFAVINRVKGIGTALKASIAVGVIQTASTVLVKKFADAGSAINDFSMRTGMSAQQISKLSYAAAQSGTDLATVETAFKRLQANVATGNPLFTQLGLSLRELQQASPDEQFNAIAKRIAEIENPTYRTAVALQLLGKSGTALIPVFKDFGTLSKEAERLGIVFTPEQAARADELGDAIGKAANAISGFAISVGSAISPDVLAYLDSFTTNVQEASKWVKENEQTVQLLAKAMVGLGIASVLAGGVSALGFALRGFDHAIHLRPIAALTSGWHLMRKEADLLKPSVDKLASSLSALTAEQISAASSGNVVALRNSIAASRGVDPSTVSDRSVASKPKPKSPKKRFNFGNALVDTSSSFTDDNATDLIAKVQKNNALLEGEGVRRTKALGALSGQQGGRLNLRYGILAESAKAATNIIQPAAGMIGTDAMRTATTAVKTTGAVTAAAESASSISKVVTAAKGLSIFARAAGWIKTAAGFVGFLVTKMNPWIAALSTLAIVLQSLGAIDWIWSWFSGKKKPQEPTKPPQPKPEPKKDTVNAREQSFQSAVEAFLQAGANKPLTAKLDPVAAAQIKGAVIGGQRIAAAANNKVFNNVANPKQLTPREQLRAMLDAQIARQGGRTTFRQRQALKMLETPEERDARLQKNINQSRKAQGLPPITVDQWRRRPQWERMNQDQRLGAVAADNLGGNNNVKAMRAEVDRLRKMFDKQQLELLARSKPTLAGLFEPTEPTPLREPRKPVWQRRAEERERQAMERANPALKDARIAANKARMADLRARGIIPALPPNKNGALNDLANPPKTVAEADANVKKQKEIAALRLEDERFRAEKYNKMQQLSAQRQLVFAGMGGSTGSFSSGVAGRMFGGGISDLTSMADAMAEVADNTSDIARDIAAIRDSGGLE